MTLKRILMFTAVAEIATGAALVIAPMLVVKLLLGVYAPWTSLSIARVLGVALFSLGIACWPGAGLDSPNPAAWRAMLAYNTLVAAYLAYLSVRGGIGGVLLWPAVALHGIVALALAWAVRGSGGAEPSAA